MNRKQFIVLNFLAVALGILAPDLSAGIVTVLYTETTGQHAATNEVTIRHEGNRCRIDHSSELTLLFDGEGDMVFQILHPAKCYVRRPSDEFPGTSPCADAKSTNLPAATGRQSVIQEYTTTEYRRTNDCGSWTFWVAPDYPNWERLSDPPESKRLNAKLRSGFGESGKNLPGMVMRTEAITTQVISGSQPVVTVTTNITTLMSVAEVADNPELMRVPADYREIASFDELATPPKTNALRIAAMDEHEAWARELSSTNTPRFGSLSVLGQAPSESWIKALQTPVPAPAGTNSSSNALVIGRLNVSSGSNVDDFPKLLRDGTNVPTFKVMTFSPDERK